MVGAVTEPDLARGERCCRAAGRPSGIQLRIPWVKCRPEYVIEGVAAGAHLRRVGLPDNNAATSL